MSLVWYFEYDGLKRPLADWGITIADLTEVNQAAGEFNFATENEDPDAAPRFEFQKVITLWRDSERWFTGPIVGIEYSESELQQHRYRAASPWWYLENIIYQQPSWVLKDLEEAALGYTDVETSRVVMGMASDGTSFDTGGQAAEIVDYAIRRGAPIARSTFSLATFIPWEKGEDLTCADALRRVLRWTRDAVAYWDYSAVVPVLHINKRADLIPSEVDVAAANLVSSIQLAPRYDLVPRGLIVNFRRILADRNGNQYVAYVRQGAGSLDQSIRCLSYTISLGGVGSQAEPVPAGLATNLYNSLSTLEWEGQVGLSEIECTGVARPGNTLNLLNGKAAWASMMATVQSVTHSIIGGQTTITVGPPAQLGVQDFLDLARFRRGSDVGNSGSERNNGKPGTPTGPTPDPGSPPPSPPDPDLPPPNNTPGMIEIHWCDNGHEKVAWVVGTLRS